MALATTGNKVSAVLADGPNPQDDPTGYAQAQMGPLLVIRAPGKAPHSALQDLCVAYVSYFTVNADPSAKLLLRRTDEQSSDVCPGVA
jgi:hypothetical protein